MAFSDLQMKTTSQFALQALYAKLAPIRDFAHNFRDLEDRKGASIVVPVFDLSAATEFNESNNDYCTNAGGVDAATVTLSTHLKQGITYTDRDVAETEVQWFRDGGIAVGSSVARGIYNTVMGLLNTTNITLTADSALSSKADFAALGSIADANNLDISQTVLMLSPTSYDTLLGTLDAYVYGGPEAIRSGYIPQLYGFKAVVRAVGLNAAFKAVLADVNSLGIASRYLAPEGTNVLNAAWKGVDENSGLTIGFRAFSVPCKGRNYLVGEVLMGAKIIRPTGFVGINAN